jgi:hypothetical protein
MTVLPFDRTATLAIIVGSYLMIVLDISSRRALRPMSPTTMTWHESTYS